MRNLFFLVFVFLSSSEILFAQTGASGPQKIEDVFPEWDWSKKPSGSTGTTGASGGNGGGVGESLKEMGKSIGEGLKSAGESVKKATENVKGGLTAPGTEERAKFEGKRFWLCFKANATTTLLAQLIVLAILFAAAKWLIPSASEFALTPIAIWIVFGFSLLLGYRGWDMIFTLTVASALWYTLYPAKGVMASEKLGIKVIIFGLGLFLIFLNNLLEWWRLGLFGILIFFGVKFFQKVYWEILWVVGVVVALIVSHFLYPFPLC